jgi:hypothetical protein
VHGTLIFVKIQCSSVRRHENSTEWLKEFWKAWELENLELFQIMIHPPEPPTEGRNSKQSKEVGQKFLRY